MVGHRLSSAEQQQEGREDNAPVVTSFPLEVAAPAGLPNIRARRSSAKAPNMSGLASLKMSSIEPGSAVMDDDGPPVSSPSAAKLLAERQRRSSAKGSKLSVTDTASEELAQKLSDALTLEEEIKSEDQAEVAEGAPTPNAYVSLGIAATSLSDKLASLRSTTSGDSSSTPPLALPVLADPQCSGYFLEPVGHSDLLIELSAHASTTSLDEMDGLVSGRRRHLRQDPLSQPTMQGKSRQLCLDRHALQLPRLGCTGMPLTSCFSA
jgi:hypothetical protein